MGEKIRINENRIEYIDVNERTTIHKARKSTAEEKAHFAWNMLK